MHFYITFSDFLFLWLHVFPHVSSQVIEIPLFFPHLGKSKYSLNTEACCHHSLQDTCFWVDPRLVIVDHFVTEHLLTCRHWLFCCSSFAFYNWVLKAKIFLKVGILGGSVITTVVLFRGMDGFQIIGKTCHVSCAGFWVFSSVTKLNCL